MSDPSRVLIVQSEDAERLFQRALFSDAGMTVMEAGSGAEALEFLASEHPDLVILGRNLPDMDGLDLLPRLKSNELDFVPVLVASHRGETAERVRGLQLGADDYLGRPCDPAELLARAKALLRNKQSHDKMRKLQQSLEQMVVSDPLTGLHNRRYLMDRLAQEMQRADRHGEPLAFAMLDLDGFKPINDQFGHIVGDKVLRAVGNAVARCVRASDIARGSDAGVRENPAHHRRAAIARRERRRRPCDGVVGARLLSRRGHRDAGGPGAFGRRCALWREAVGQEQVQHRPPRAAPRERLTRFSCGPTAAVAPLR